MSAGFVDSVGRDGLRRRLALLLHFDKPGL
jgi:hypothetical protein